MGWFSILVAAVFPTVLLADADYYASEKRRLLTDKWINESKSTLKVKCPRDTRMFKFNIQRTVNYDIIGPRCDKVISRFVTRNGNIVTYGYACGKFENDKLVIEPNTEIYLYILGPNNDHDSPLLVAKGEMKASGEIEVVSQYIVTDARKPVAEQCTFSTDEKTLAGEGAVSPDRQDVLSIFRPKIKFDGAKEAAKPKLMEQVSPFRPAADGSAIK